MARVVNAADKAFANMSPVTKHYLQGVLAQAAGFMRTMAETDRDLSRMLVKGGEMLSYRPEIYTRDKPAGSLACDDPIAVALAGAGHIDTSLWDPFGGAMLVGADVVTFASGSSTQTVSPKPGINILVRALTGNGVGTTLNQWEGSILDILEIDSCVLDRIGEILRNIDDTNQALPGRLLDVNGRFGGFQIGAVVATPSRAPTFTFTDVSADVDGVLNLGYVGIPVKSGFDMRIPSYWFPLVPQAINGGASANFAPKPKGNWEATDLCIHFSRTVASAAPLYGTFYIEVNQLETSGNKYITGEDVNYGVPAPYFDIERGGYSLEYGWAGARVTPTLSNDTQDLTFTLVNPTGASNGRAGGFVRGRLLPSS